MMTPGNDPFHAIGTDTIDHIADPTNPVVATGGEPAGAASLEKVRDILFGSQMRDVDRRFARLEERIAKDTRDLKDEIKSRLDAFELYVRGETESLANQARNEQTERAEADGRLARDLGDASRAFERRAAALDELISKHQRDTRQQMLEQHQRLSDDLRQKVDEVLAALAREAQELRHDKTDRLALASLLKEMAMRLSGDFKFPVNEDRGNG